MTNSASKDLITIGVLARSSGLTASALRFYDDCKLLVPARVDPDTGYRYYTELQRERALTIRRLREIEVPLETVARVLAGDADTASALLDEHVRALTERALDAAAVAAEVKLALASTASVSLSAAELAAAIDQVLQAAAIDEEIPALAGLLLEAAADALTLTATNRYRLSTRTLVPRAIGGAAWSAVVVATECASTTAWLRELGEVSLTPQSAAVRLSGAGAERLCPTIAEDFPDYRTMLAALAPVRTRVVIERAALLEAVREAGPDAVRCVVGPDGVAISGAGRAPRPQPALVTGPAIELAFDPGNLLPALASAVGPEVMVDISGADQPVIIRSATDGDVTTLVMPVAQG